jgi:hypothetical protein
MYLKYTMYDVLEILLLEVLNLYNKNIFICKCLVVQ